MTKCKQCDGSGIYGVVICPSCKGDKNPKSAMWTPGEDPNKPIRTQRMIDANDRQYGGSHYKSDYQHWDWVVDVSLGYFEAAATKYVTRYKDKNGEEDLNKAEHYLQKMLELIDAGKYYRVRHGQPTKYEEFTSMFCSINNIGDLERFFMHRAADWQCSLDIMLLLEILTTIKRMHSAAQRGRSGPAIVPGASPTGAGTVRTSDRPGGGAQRPLQGATAPLAVGSHAVIKEQEFIKGVEVLGSIVLIKERDEMRYLVKVVEPWPLLTKEFWIARSKLMPHDGMANPRGYDGEN